jgi:hypothetical protein
MTKPRGKNAAWFQIVHPVFSNLGIKNNTLQTRMATTAEEKGTQWEIIFLRAVRRQ